ncbi:hypothetical protein PROFUN_16441 [Planoprotostelium fungivorum]|uniref:Uncharacterized protein n=1 Tax=Planoprotostelium fungivorum TaxID=1890364 RepID=A0A2P6MQ19_9EUKA|nr:hypothetical protein PROFUN_16441 [Planoprotostelium fungivorum]
MGSNCSWSKDLKISHADYTLQRTQEGLYYLRKSYHCTITRSSHIPVIFSLCLSPYLLKCDPLMYCSYLSDSQGDKDECIAKEPDSICGHKYISWLDIHRQLRKQLNLCICQKIIKCISLLTSSGVAAVSILLEKDLCNFFITAWFGWPMTSSIQYSPEFHLYQIEEHLQFWRTIPAERQQLILAKDLGLQPGYFMPSESFPNFCVKLHLGIPITLDFRIMEETQYTIQKRKVIGLVEGVQPRVSSRNESCDVFDDLFASKTSEN